MSAFQITLRSKGLNSPDFSTKDANVFASFLEKCYDRKAIAVLTDRRKCVTVTLINKDDNK